MPHVPRGLEIGCPPGRRAGSGGWRDIHWVIEGPTVASNIENLGLEQAGLAVEHSEVVRSFGAWNIRRVDPSPQSVTDP